MSEATEFCPKCGTNLEPASTNCPGCGAALDGSDSAATGGGLGAILASAKTHIWYLAGGVIAVAAIAAVLVFGNVFGPSGRAVCTATLNQARDFGVISPSAVLASTSAKSTDVKNRKSCAATVGEDTYTLTADIKTEDAAHKKCKDYVKQGGCVQLYSVARSDGMTTYQMREIPPGETDEALANEGVLPTPQAVAPNAAAPAGEPTAGEPPAGAQGGIDTETAVDNSGGSMQGPAQPAPQSAPPQ